MNRTRGPSSSCNADLRYAAAKSGFFRSRRMMASSCEMLALRFMGFRSIFLIFKILHTPARVSADCFRPSLPQRGHAYPLTIIAIDTVDRSTIDQYLEYNL